MQIFNESIKQKPFITLKNIKKNFGNVQALNNVNLRVFPGQVMAILGENGAGKSTLMNILSGVHKRSSGQILDEHNFEMEFQNIKDAEKFGITIIHQEILAFQDMTVLDNVFIGHEIRNKIGLIDYKKEKRLFFEALTEIGMHIDPGTLMSQLTIAQQQMIGIAKAILKESKIIIMDEPTSSLSKKETDVLFKIIKKLKEQNKAILYISHRLDEIPLICDFITIIRDGQYIGEFVVGEINEDEIINHMVGREVTQKFPDKINSKSNEKILEVKNLTTDLFSNVSFEVMKGEILGFSGLVGSKRTEIFKTIIGLIKKQAGVVTFHGNEINLKSPSQAIKTGIYYVTEDRKVEGLFLDDSIKNNILLSSLKSVSHYGILSQNLEKETVNKYFNELKIKASNAGAKVKTMSGGNQQKVLIAKALAAQPKLIIFDEPTRGVDVGARREIYDLIVNVQKSGVPIILISSDLPEIVGMSNRVIVVKEGKITKTLATEINAENIMQYAI
ncbi:sugar ABC transporter ATP-binding protein [Spiroplasma clarkii]|uniref:Ribose ABC transporter ATP-binding protein n=2 Tax=Spiroplasma clarkii TaxID=2139 RepID=A0A2K8KML1_9MOLU|nr:sugar ABC transporter ATP-binding protein [Spiroplasma clarkii]ATX70794.1 ribose ABC transporter ATP-binding protein [Spiroplasma clarkii]